MLRGVLLRAARTRSKCAANAAFSTCSRTLAASNMGMPAMSPTMTEGGIVEWKVKEGDSFAAGDVLLEIETDKAQIDVEAADDGKMAKIYAKAGESGIPVGKTIAVLADEGDDLATLEIPPPEGGSAAPAEEPEAEAKAEPAKAEPAKAPKAKPAASNAASAKANPNQAILPSVQSLLTANKISVEDAYKEISASGPNGRILKGDVLAYLGRVSADHIAALNAELKKLSALDLSNIQLKSPESAPSAQEKPAASSKPDTTEQKPLPSFSAAIDLSSLELFTATVDATLSASLNKDKLIAKASKLALLDVPRLSRPKKSILNDPTFEALIAPKYKTPFEVSFESVPAAANAPSKKDIFDVLSSNKKPSSPSSPRSNTLNVTVRVSTPGGEKKAQLYLDRLAYYLTDGKGDLIL